jgi:hypothetical protein
MSLDIYLYSNYCEHCKRGDEVYHGNVTHNLGAMAKEASLYNAMWRPEEIGAKFARQIVYLLIFGIDNLKTEPEAYKKMNPENGWGSYDGLLRVAMEYAEACKKYPDAFIEVSR